MRTLLCRRKALRGGLGWACIAAVMLLHAVPVWAASDDANEKIRFKWAFGAVVGEGADRKLQPITQDTQLKSGDQFKMMIEPERNCFLYVFYLNSQGEMSMLFPYDLKQFDEDYQPGTSYFVPMGDGWYELDEHMGTEAFTVIGAAERQKGIEELYRQYGAASGTQKAELLGRLQEEIRSLRRSHRELTAPAERPVVIGGAIRGLAKSPSPSQADVAALAQDFAAADFFARTISIEHQ